MCTAIIWHLFRPSWVHWKVWWWIWHTTIWTARCIRSTHVGISTVCDHSYGNKLGNENEYEHVSQRARRQDARKGRERPFARKRATSATSNVELGSTGTDTIATSVTAQGHARRVSMDFARSVQKDTGSAQDCKGKKESAEDRSRWCWTLLRRSSEPTGGQTAPRQTCWRADRQNATETRRAETLLSRWTLTESMWLDCLEWIWMMKIWTQFQCFEATSTRMSSRRFQPKSDFLQHSHHCLILFVVCFGNII